MVASLAYAEDIVSEAGARWCAIDQSSLESPEAWLTTVTTRLGIDRLRNSRRDRERYVGPWLPEPVVTEPGPEQRAERADSLTLGFSTVLDRLEPVERAEFLMADVFEVPFAAISEAVDKAPPACRQIASRARRKLHEARMSPPPADRRPVDELLVALWLGDMDAVLSRLGPDVVCISDGGAKRYAARRPVQGAVRAARFLTTSPALPRPDNGRSGDGERRAGGPGAPGWPSRLCSRLRGGGRLRPYGPDSRNPDKLHLITSGPRFI